MEGAAASSMEDLVKEAGGREGKTCHQQDNHLLEEGRDDDAGAKRKRRWGNRDRSSAVFQGRKKAGQLLSAKKQGGSYLHIMKRKGGGIWGKTLGR